MARFRIGKWRSRLIDIHDFFTVLATKASNLNNSIIAEQSDFVERLGLLYPLRIRQNSWGKSIDSPDHPILFKKIAAVCLFFGDGAQGLPKQNSGLRH
jgi:hypothetical protein